MGFRLEQFDAVLSARDEGGKPFLLIGGQAVYFWATAYELLAGNFIFNPEG